LVATGTVFRNYQLPALTNLLFVTVYHDALTKAGWTIVDQRMSADALIVAHYGLKGRNIWATLHNNSEGYSVAVADTGTQLGAALTKNCHVALYGVLFDFNQSTLQPSSDAVLQQVANLLTANKALKLEVQGHTDNVGNDAYNQTLSEARARSVVAWLTHHDVAADRLTSKGYGKTRPVATNATDEGRAKNRRVEIADPACVSKARP
jgi:OmpA-OmpF porin, OOP family